MKKFIALILAVLYMGSSTGATFHMHYCNGVLMDVQLWHSSGTQCSKCGTTHSKSCAKKCCRDEHKTVKLEKDQKAAENTLHFMQLAVAAVPLPWLELPQADVVRLTAVRPLINAPPRSSKVLTHILHCTFRI
ncbi:HYC_CC_PP family protein [Chitinophaga solisilvae]|uniref:Uncharacterized protein n=1 Tax=Chitinophaga solisilvae TaxID=1233460 RepID=A0A9Q5D4K9_9BACT|nr:hypothetical protein [Chitinophaga solisilvae]NSL90898.1 hypothetical protein [Chitinophaga solisilvae]